MELAENLPATKYQRWLTRFRAGKRIAATVVFFLVVAAVLYSIVVPVFIYSLLFGAERNTLNFFWYGLGAPFRDFPYRSVLIFALFTALLIVSFAQKRVRLFARWPLLIFTGSVSTMLMALILVYWQSGGLYKKGLKASRCCLISAD